MRSPSSFFRKFIYFITYPALNIFFIYSGLGMSWTLFYSFFASGLMLLMTVLLIRPIIVSNIRARANPISTIIFFLMAFFLSLYMNPVDTNYAFYGLVGIGTLFIAMTYLLKRFNLIVKIKKSIKNENLWFYWFIYVLAASIITSVDLSKINNMTNLLPVFIIQTVFGWMGPEVTYRLIDGLYGPVKALAIYIILMLTIAFFYGYILEDVLRMHNFASDGPKIVGVIFLAIPSMLLSRIIFNVSKNYKF